MRRVLIIAIVGLILISLLEWGINNEIGHYRAEEQTNQNQSTTFSGPVFLGLRDGLADVWHWIGGHDDELLVIFTAILAFVTILLVKYTRGLLMEAQKQFPHFKDNVAAATKAANAAMDSANLAREEFNSSHRPWITIKEIKVREPVNSSSPSFNLSYGLENVGHSPAFVLIRDEIIVSDPKIRWQDRQPEFCTAELEKVKSDGWEARWTVFPGDPFPYHRNNVKVTGETGKEYLPILIGCIFYRAIWSDVIHKTPFVATISNEPIEEHRARDNITKFSPKEGTISESKIVVKALCITGDAD